MREKIYEKIFENLEDLLAEEQAKLGYRKEPVRFYYPLSSLNHFFDASFSEEEMKAIEAFDQGKNIFMNHEDAAQIESFFARFGVK